MKKIAAKGACTSYKNRTILSSAYAATVGSVHDKRAPLTAIFYMKKMNPLVTLIRKNIVITLIFNGTLL